MDPAEPDPGDAARPDPRRWLARGLALLAGAALSLTFPEPALWWWAYVGLVPVLLLVARAGDRREAVWRSWLAASGFFTALHWWLLPHLSVFAVPAAILVGLAWVPWGLVAHTLLRPPLTGRRLAAALVLLPAIWLVAEYVRSWDRLGGSWGFLGLTQWNVRPVLAVAALGGVWALSLLLILINVAVAAAFLAPAPATRLGALAVAGVLVGSSVAYGLSRPEPPVEGTLVVGGVQPGLGYPHELLDNGVRLTRELVQREPEVQVVVWGQSSVAYDLATDGVVRERLLALADEIDRPIVVNTDARRIEGRITKTSVVIHPDGLGATYHKQRLVPFGEYIPLRSLLGWIARFTKAAGEDRVPGSTLTTFDLAGARVGPLISYESTFPDLRLALARMDVQITIVQAAATTFQGTWALPQQGSFEAVQAVSSGRPAVLVALSGTSSAFDARGRQLAWVPQTETGAWAVEMPLSRERTLFVRWGPWIPISAIVICVLAAPVALARRMRRARAGGS